MNAREQYLQARVRRLEELVAFLAADIEFTESVGAAFAFDLGQRVFDDLPYIEQVWLAADLLANWDTAMKAMRGAADAAR
jgi:hypothetical protein